MICYDVAAMKVELAALVALMAISVGAQISRSVRKELDGDYKEFSRAFEANHIDAIGSMLTDDFTVVHKGEPDMNKAQVIAAFKQQAAMSKNVRWPRKIVRIKAQPHGGVLATVAGHFVAVVSQGKGKHKLEMASSTRDLWVHTDTGLKLKRSEVTSMKMSMDGKPIGPRG